MSFRNISFQVIHLEVEEKIRQIRKRETRKNKKKREEEKEMV
jgi:hypothetical protein